MCWHIHEKISHRRMGWSFMAPQKALAEHQILSLVLSADMQNWRWYLLKFDFGRFVSGLWVFWWANCLCHNINFVVIEQPLERWPKFSILLTLPYRLTKLSIKLAIKWTRRAAASQISLHVPIPPNFFHLGVKWLMSRELWHRQGSNRKRNIKSCNLKKPDRRRYRWWVLKG